jgi:hypothetical protein
MTRSLWLGGTALALIGLGASTAGAGAAPTRVVTARYTLATSAAAPLATPACCAVLPGVTSAYGMAAQRAGNGERHVSVVVADHEIGAVSALVDEIAPDGSIRHLATICGSTTRALALPYAGRDVVVRPAYGACGSFVASAPTSGTVTFRFSR